MINKKQLYPNLPLYLITGLLFSVAVWSLWLPHWLNQDSIRSARAAVMSYGTPVNAVSMVPKTSKSRVIYETRGRNYAMVFTSTTDTASPTSTCGTGSAPNDRCTIYFTSSSDGVVWSNPRVVTTTLLVSQGSPERLNTFTYSDRDSQYALVFSDYYNRNLNLIRSYDGVTWNSLIAVSTGGQNHTPNQNAYVAFSTSSNLRAALVQKGPYIVIATTSDADSSSGWATSTVMDVTGYANSDEGYDAAPMGVSINGPSGSEIIHAVFGLATTTAAGGYEIVYASSTNSGLTWTTSSISGRIPQMSAAFAGFEFNINTSAIDVTTGRLSVVYYQLTAAGIGSSLLTTSSIIYGELNANNTWTTTTLQTNVPINFDPMTPGGNDYYFEPTGITMLTTGVPYIVFMGTSTLPFVAVNTSTFFVEQLNTVTTSNAGELTVAYFQDDQVASVAYVNNNKIKFVTSTLGVASLNTAATTTAITPSFPVDGTGKVTVSTTVSDENFNTVTLFVDYSVNGGTTWVSSTINTVTGTLGSFSTSTGKITGISTASESGNTVTFLWDSQVDLASTSTGNIRLRILADDGLSNVGYRQSANFTIDNLAPDVPGSLLLSSITTSSMTLSWGSVTGGTMYGVSSTAASASTTSIVTSSFTGLTPNTQYLFQVRSADAYSNTSTFATASSSYTNANIPSSISATNNGETSLIVSWVSDNASGTTYELYNVTTDAVVGTTTETSYTVTGLTAGTSYQFKVRARYFSNTSTYSDYSSNSTAVGTTAATTSSSSGGGGGPSSAPPPVPSKVPALVQTPLMLELTLNKPVTQVVGASSHTFTPIAATASSATVIIQSDPIKATLLVNKPQDFDTNNDAFLDLRVTYKGLVKGKPIIEAVNLTDESELNNAFTISNGAYETNNQKVTLILNVPNAVQIAVSNDSTFAGAGFQSYTKKLSWTLSDGNGEKTVYIKFRSSAGGTTTASDSIRLSGQSATMPPVSISTPVVCSLSVQTPYLYPGKKAVYYILPNCTRAVFENEAKYFSYFSSWDSVKKVSEQELIKIPLANTVLPFGSLNPGTKNTIQQPSVVFSKNLRYGNVGNEVKALQVKLQDLGFLDKSIKPNGVFGPATLKAVKKFQTTRTLPPVGQVGPQTRALLNTL